MRLIPTILSIVCAVAAWTGCTNARQSPSAVPDWAAEQVWYQVFPERFRNGDPANDPVREGLPSRDRVPESWRITPWTGSWYGRAPWEAELSPDFYRSVRLRRYGGDLQGVIDRLPYLERLGVTALYFNPLFWARSEHKYDGNGFHHIDPWFGPDPSGDLARMEGERLESGEWPFTRADSLFLALVDEAHSRGLRVIIDGVFNHVGGDFPAFADLRARGPASPYRDWFKVLSWDDPATPEDEFDYEGWSGSRNLPEFADTPDGEDLAPGPKAYVFAATERWLDPNSDGDPSDGVDGWRLDVARDVPIRFWADWNRHVRSVNPRAYTVTEIWDDAVTFVREGGFSASMNYHGFAFPVKGFLVDGRMKASGFVRAIEERRASHAPEVAYAMQNLIDSHDTERLASMIVNAARGLPYQREDSLVWFDYDWGPRSTPSRDSGYLLRPPATEEREIQRLVALFQMTGVGAPMIYYGTEAGMWGADDPDDRSPMWWDDLPYEDVGAGPRGEALGPHRVEFDAGLHAFYRLAIGLRRSHPALRTGSIDFVHADDASRTVAFVRTLEDETVVVALNRGARPATVRIPRARAMLGPGEGLYPVFSTLRDARDLSPGADGADVVLELAPREGVALIRSGVE